MWSDYVTSPVGTNETFATSAVGRYVKVQYDGTNTGEQYLQIAEVDAEGTPPVSGAPEPATFWLMGTGLVGLVSVTRSRKRSGAVRPE